jgi:alcohol dehydrogenase class IV
VHGFAGPVGGWCNAPHGAVCARLLPVVFEANARAAAEGRGPADLPERLTNVAQLLTDRDDASAADGAAWLRKLCADLDIPGLSKWGVTANDTPALVDAARKASSMKGNPVELSDGELTGILRDAL